MKTVATMQVIQLLERCEALGVDPAALLGSAGLTPSALADPEGRLPVATFLQLLAVAERTAGDSLIGLRAGVSRQPRGVLVYQARAQRSLKDALAQFARNARLAADPLLVELCESARGAWLCVGLDGRERDVVCLAREYIAGFLIKFLEAVAPSFCPRQVWFPHAARAEPAAYECLLGAPVRFRQRCCAIEIAPDLLAAPLPAANEVVAGIFDEQIARRLEALRAGAFRARVERAMEALLRERRPVGRASVARQLGVSVRTLQRRLEAEPCTFRGVRAAVLQEVAAALLAQPSLSLTEVALRLGFAEEDGFAKAWKRWTGRTPREERRRANA